MRRERPTRRRSLHLVALLAAVLGASPALAAVLERDAHAEGAPAPGRRAWLGVELGRGPAGGVVARHVSRTSPAESAGLKDGDQIVAVDGKPVDAPGEVVARVAAIGPDGAITLRLRRGGAEKNVTARLVAHPGNEEVVRRDRVGTFAPDWGPLTPASGSPPATVQAARGQVLIVDFWASWCGPCKLVTPTLSALQDRFGAQGLTVLGISSDEPKVAVRSARNLGIRYATGTETNGQASMAYGVRAIPTMYVIDRQGVVREVLVGFHPRHAAALEQLVTKLLAEPAPGAPSPTPAPPALDPPSGAPPSGPGPTAPTP